MVNTSSRRTVSRPGVNGDSGSSNFQSPYQPPPAELDFDGDLAMMSPDAYTLVQVEGYFWRIKIPTPEALKHLAGVPDLEGSEQIHAMNAFLQRHIHPDDFRLVLQRMLDPDDTFTAEHYTDLYRQAVTVGTARPFRLSSASPARLSIAGGLFEQSWHSQVFLRRYML